MNDSALKSFCTWARTELIKGVEAQMVRYGITELAHNANMLFYMVDEGKEGRNAFLEKRDSPK